MAGENSWWVKGTLFENCNCQIVCPGHFHFTQLCTHQRCRGYWGVAVEDGRFGSLSLAGVKLVIVFDSPQHMASGDWVITTYMDHSLSADQQLAMETILSGEAEGPWKVLGRFIGQRQPTIRETIVFLVEPKSLSARVGNFLQSLITPLKGRDRERPVLLENNYNQIHAPRQELGMGSTRYEGSGFSLETQDTHALQSNFSWSGSF